MTEESVLNLVVNICRMEAVTCMQTCLLAWEGSANQSYSKKRTLTGLPLCWKCGERDLVFPCLSINY